MEIEVFISEMPRDTYQFLHAAFFVKYGAPMPRIRTAEWGKPYFDTAESGVCFSISHSGRYIVCVFDEEDIGIDIQRIKRIPQNVIRRYLHTDSTERSKQILEWTKLESYGKLLGTGIPLPDGEDYSAGRFLYTLEPDGYVVSVCLRSDRYDSVKPVSI